MKRLLIAGAALVALAACSSPSQSASTEQPAESRTLTVFAAASLTESFNALEQTFEQQNPGVDVVLSYGGSSDLAQQIVNGAPADVFAAASDSTMKTVTDAQLTAAAPTIFATNVLQIATAPGNPKGVAAFADLAKPDLKTVVCAPQVPCGAATAKIEQSTGVDIPAVSEEPDVKSVLAKVSTGNADAGLVYVTDVNASKGQVQGVSFPESSAAKTNYPIAVVKNAPQAELAQKWVALVEGQDGANVLGAQGFGRP
ncbi:molybdate ABC transporter substrate-binding protein [Pseudonocardia sp. WMMC193]|uniref:molybdate ABC transporter substrate-binding protein n=1 Tax=Pseudonocardia sp. WMMC193 TaxID=2911965 RepID=UPI001F0242DE|nr:molybdate ABC transporter substrate-binding protein [Pseudonocardia sp. WMMC193]MCF7552887.1 molybdate ABC transporter substrate-binding protein [Pseudonocardia sp. WMMC193]